jgi:hypothetical protein
VSSYYAYVTNTPAATVQVPDSIKSRVFTVTVLPPAKSIAGAALVVTTESYVYDGVAKEPAVDVTLDGVPLYKGTDYEVKYVDNLNAGSNASVQVIGIRDYKDTLWQSFSIAKHTLTADDLIYTPRVAYNGQAQPVVVRAKVGNGILGAVTVLYDGASTVPINMGTWEVTASVAAGTNFTALEGPVALGTYTIARNEQLTLSDVTFTIPTNHKVNGQPQGIGPVSVRGSDYGVVTVLYNDSLYVPSDSGTYVVKVSITGGTNYAASSLVLGNYVIAGLDVSVASSDRVIPGGKDAVVVVAPVSVVAGEFTVGPNPVSKASGKVGFFWQGSSLVSGSLYVFDASGNLLKKAAVSDRSVGKDRREVGSWNLSDAAGRPVSEGTYLVKGALVTGGGSKVKVSSVLGVR